jgi:hypothetical protein
MKIKHYDLSKLVEPRRVRIGSAEEKLYALEEKRNKIIHACAEEWARIVEKAFEEKSDKWKQSIPQALFDTLESFQTDCSLVACIAFLKLHGVIVEWKDNK